MDSRKFVLTETAIVLAGEIIGSAAMVGVFALVGALAATLNFFFMALFATMAADKATEQEVSKGQAMIKASYLIRTAVLFVVLFAFAKSGLCNAIALVVPLIFIRLTLTIVEFFRKPGDSSK